MKYPLLCIIGFMLFAGCTEESDSSQKGKFLYEQILKKHAIEQTQIEETSEAKVDLLLQESNGKLEIFLKNPQANDIRSVRSWLAFPAGELTIKNLNLNNEIFDLAAPNEYSVDKKNGLIKIGLSSTKGTKEKNVLIGSFDVLNNSKADIPLSCYDYNNGSDSHCIVLDANSNNVLQPVNPVLIPKK